MGQTVAAMRSLAMVVIPALVATMVEAQYGAGAVTGASADMTGTLHRGAAAQAAPAATLPTEATTTVASTTTTNLAAVLPTTGGRRGLRGEGSPAMATADSPATMDTTTGARATTPATTMAMDIILAMAMVTIQVTAMGMVTIQVTTTTGAVVSETVSVLPTSSAATFDQATSAPDQTTMVDQIIWPLFIY